MHSKTQVLDPTVTELESIKALQSYFQKKSFLYYFDPSQPLFININFSK